MNTSTQAMNAINKVQTPNQGNKANTDKKGPDLQFEALFSSALGQIAPNAQLNSIESQLRESLFKQDKPRKDTESNINAEAAQAAVWAQRNWMQQASAPAPQAATQSVSNTGNSTVKNPQATEELAKPQAANTQNANATAKESEAPAKQSSPDTAAKPAEDSATAQATVPATGNNPQASAPQQASTTVLPGDNALTSPMGTSTDFANPTANTSTSSSSTANLQNPTQVNLTTTGTPVVPTTEAPGQTRDTGNAQIDAVLNAGTISKAGDPVTAAPPTGITTSSNASAVAAQLAPQIAQQAQGMEAELEVGELKAGQKILAGSNLQAAGNSNAMAAGTNGLTGTSATAQQALIKTPVNQPGFAKELGQTVQWAIGKNMSTVDIRVNPESFGPMNMRLVQKGQQVQLVIRTQDEASANLLTQSLSNLKEVLAQNGLQLNQVQIQHGNTPSAGQGQQNQSQAQFEQNSGQQGRGGQQSASGGTAADDHGPAATPVSGTKPAGQLDMFA